MKCCYIFGAGNCADANISVQPSALIIAADGGYTHLEKLKILPDIVVGDFDSLGYVPQNVQTVRHPVMKDETDMMLAVDIGFKRGCDCFYIYGGLGGRTDHVLANIQTLRYITEHSGRGYLIGSGECITVIQNSSLTFRAGSSGTVSVFSCGGTARGVTLKGLLYPLRNAVLSPSVPIGVSNDFTGEKAEITVLDGFITILWSGRIAMLG